MSLIFIVTNDIIILITLVQKIGFYLLLDISFSKELSGAIDTSAILVSST